MNSITAASSWRAGPRAPKAFAARSTSAGRRRLPPEPTMYWEIVRISTTSESRRRRITSSTIRRSAATGCRMASRLGATWGWRSDKSLTLRGNSGIIAGSVTRPGNTNPMESTMYAVIKTGGKQYRVAPGEKIKIEQIPADVGAQVVLDQVLMVSDGDAVKLGNPLVSGATVSCTVLAHGRGVKVKIFKMRRRKHYQKTQGHRQNYTEIRVDAIA